MAVKEMVYITHEATGAVGGPVPRGSYDRMWSKRGWTEASETQIATRQAADAARGRDDALEVVAQAINEEGIGSMTREELDILAAQAGIDSNQFHTKAELIAALESQGG
jgi:protein-disulfide isomerase-like protein with CxxC motif